VCTGALVVGLDNLILNVALPTLVRDLDASTSELQWIVDAYVLSLAGLLLMGGSLGDRFGRARVFRIGLVIFGISSLFAAFASDATTLAMCRAVMGVAAALIMPTTIAIITNIFTDVRERGRALGLWSAVGGLGFALGPVLGGVLLSQFWWGSVFFVNVPVVVVTLLVSWIVVPESRNPSGTRFDVLGVVLSVVSVSALVWATIEAPTHGWGSATTLRSFAIGFALLTAFIWWELRCAHPMLQMRFFRNARFSVATITCATGNFAFAGELFVLTQLLQFVFGYSPLRAGLALVPLAVGFMSGCVFGPRLSERIGTKRDVALGLGIFAVGLVVLTTAGVDSGYAVVVLAAVMTGGGFGLIAGPTTDAVVGAVPREQAGVASGTLSTGRQVSTAIGVAVMGSLLVSGYRSSLAAHAGALHLSTADRTEARSSVGGALAVASDVGGAAGRALADAAREAFVHGMRLGLVVGAALLAVGVVLALRYLPDHAFAADEVAHAQSLDVVVD
jgi:EmrB/QacA subfamily drug resistance transporter